MKIAFVDTSLDGHHLSYINCLINTDKYESLAILPKRAKELDCRQIELTNFNFETKNIYYYKKLLDKIYFLLVDEKVNIVHFLYGDIFYRFFGFGLKKFEKFNTIITFHHIRRSTLHEISIKRIFRKIHIGVVHTNSLIKDLNNIGISNVIHIEYPKFKGIESNSKEYALNYFNLPKDIKIISAIGGTRFDKGLDILLTSLCKVKNPFYLLIAGAESTFKKQFILDKIDKYQNNVTLILHYLSDKDLAMCICATDIIILPYRYIFDGASGPLVEGVWSRKTIIGPNHGSLKDIIESNQLGFTFETENLDDLAKTIDEALEGKYSWNDKSEKYRMSLDSGVFKKEYYELYKKRVK